MQIVLYLITFHKYSTSDIVNILGSIVFHKLKKVAHNLCIVFD